MFTIKLQQQGNALNMTIPPETIERLGLHAGQELTLTERGAGFELITREARIERQRMLAQKVLREQAETLKALAHL